MVIIDKLIIIMPLFILFTLLIMSAVIWLGLTESTVEIMCDSLFCD